MSTLDNQLLHPNGAWCWFQDPRMVVDKQTGNVVFATVANWMGTNGDEVDANIDLTTFDPKAGNCTTVTLGNIPTGEKGDDHNVAAVWQRPDGHYLTLYTGHNYGKGSHGRPRGIDTHPDTFYRISLHPNDATAWGEEQTFRWPSNDASGKSNAVTYSNLHYLTEEGGEKGRLYNIARSSGQIWQIATSDDWGETWTYRGFLSAPPPGGRDYSNGYVKFSDNGKDRIDFLITEAHPRDFNNGVYHGYVQNGKSHMTDGTVVDETVYEEAGPTPESFTPVFIPKAMEPGNLHTGWSVELSRTEEGTLVALFLTRCGAEIGPLHTDRAEKSIGTADHRLFYAELMDGFWKTTELAKLGAGLLDSEQDYTGLGVIDRKDGNTVYVSTPIDPRDNSVLEHHELFKGTRSPDSDDWQWTAITQDSSADNLRPQLAHFADGSRLLMWMHGTYNHQTRYDTRVLAKRV